MSGLEVVGALASVGQLMSYVVEITGSLCNLYRQLRNAPKIFRRYADTAQQLDNVINLLRSNTWLRTTVILEQLKSISEKLQEALTLLPHVSEARSFLSKLSGKTRRAYQYFRSEDELKTIFVALEGMKSSLALCLLNTQVRQAGQASQNTTELLKILPMIGQMRQEFSSLRELIKPAMPQSPSLDFENDIPSSSPVEESSSLYSRGLSVETTSQPNSLDRINQAGDEMEDNPKVQNKEHGNLSVEASPTRDCTYPNDQEVFSIYNFQLAMDKSRQINGSVLSCSSKARQNQYNRNASFGSSLQINGDVCSDASSFWSHMSNGSR